MTSKKPSKKRTDWKAEANRQLKRAWSAEDAHYRVELDLQSSEKCVRELESNINFLNERVATAIRERDELRAEVKHLQSLIPHIHPEIIKLDREICRLSSDEPLQNAPKPSLRQRLRNWFKRRSQAKRTVFTEAR